MLKRVCALFLFLALAAPALWADKPALVVVISVDQLRGDLPLQYKDRFGADGFHRFFDHGTVYTNAHYGHVTTYTAVGHASIATGGNPREHGIVGNDWYNPKTGDYVYCVTDDDLKLLGVADAKGASPKNLLTPTIGDALMDGTNGKSRVFSVSGKDRSGVLMGGHLGKAFWYSNVTGAFVTSTYYYSAFMPKWAEDFNKGKPADRYLGGAWNLIKPESEYLNPDKRPVELAHADIGGVFPHSFVRLDPATLYKALSYTPFTDELVIDFCEAAIQNEQLGQRGATDLLMVGLSSTDLIGHQFGPESREQEDNLLRLDALLAKFFAYLDQTVGQGKFVVALSADHGVDGNPGGKPSGQVDTLGLVNGADWALKQKFPDHSKFVLGFEEPCLYLTPAAKEQLPGNINEMQDIAAEALMRVDGVAYAIPSHKIDDGTLDASDPLMEMIKRAYRPGVSGDIFVLQKPNYRIFSGKPTYTATHGSPYEYDTHVPVYFYGPGIATQALDTAVGPESIAATLAALLDIPKPSGATGPVLQEVIGK